MRSVLAPQTGTSFSIDAGQILTVHDPNGGQVADLFCFPSNDLSDGLSSGRSIDYNETIAFTTGHVLYSGRGRELLRIGEDSCGTHDFFLTPCSLQMFQMMAKNTAYHPSCQENLARAFVEYGIDDSYIGTTFNIFMNVPVAADGRIRVEAPRSKAGDSIRFVALTNLLIGLTACSDEGSNGGVCKAIEFEIANG